MLERGGVDLVAGPDAYRDLPRLLGLVGTPGGEEGAGAVNVQVSEAVGRCCQCSHWYWWWKL